MADRTSIEWTDATWNPVTGCTEVSPGCDHCYARTFAERWRGTPGHHFEHGFDVTLRPERMDQPQRWRRPRRIFVNSMSDLFHADIDDDYIACVFAVMASTQRHTYQVLTKRHGRMRSLLSSEAFRANVIAWLQHWADECDTRFEDDIEAVEGDRWPLPNVWLGVSVENQQWAHIRTEALLDTPAAVRWLSCEPLLGPVELKLKWLQPWLLRPELVDTDPEAFARLPYINWVVVGGESGPGARPMDPGWVRALRDQCTAAGAAFLFKQWGAWAPAGRGIGMAQHNVGRELLVGPPLDDMGHRQIMRRVSKKAAGRVLDGQIWDQFPRNAVSGAARLEVS